MRASSRRFARALAERLGEVVPAPLTVSAHGSDISLYAAAVLQGGSASARLLDEEDGRSLAERMQLAVRGVLDGIQDCVMEYLREEWPADRSGRSGLAGVRIEANCVYPWYGESETDAVIRLRPIGFAEIQQ